MKKEKRDEERQDFAQSMLLVGSLACRTNSRPKAAAAAASLVKAALTTLGPRGGPLAPSESMASSSDAMPSFTTASFVALDASCSSFLVSASGSSG
jgi:hypothetical protein